MQIFFCEKCSKRLSDVDIEKGSAIVVNDLVYCRACAQSSGIHAAVKSESSGDRPKSGKHITTTKLHISGTGQTQPKSATRQYVLPLAIVGIAVLVLIGFVVSMSPKRGNQAVNPPLPAIPEKPRIEQSGTGSQVVPAPTVLPKEPPRPLVTEPPVPSPEPPKPVQPVQSEDVVFSSDFENSAAGWDTTERVEITTLPGSKWAGKAIETSMYYSRRAVLTAWGIRPKIEYLVSGSDNSYISFDYFVSGGTSTAKIGATIFEETTDQNWDARDIMVEKDKWGTFKYSVARDFRPDTGKPPQMPSQAVVTALKIGVRPAGEEFTLLIDNVRITRPKAAAVVPAPVQETTSGKETVVLLKDFETGSNGWVYGARISDNVPPGAKWAFRASSEPESKEYFSRAIELSSVEMKPTQLKLFVFSTNQYLVIDYFLTGAAAGEYPLYIMCYDSTSKGNMRYGLSSPLQGKWTTIKLPLRSFKTLAGVGMSPGDWVKAIIIGAGSPGEQAELIVSSLRVVEE